MRTRDIRFGSITLTTNGFDSEIYCNFLVSGDSHTILEGIISDDSFLVYEDILRWLGTTDFGIIDAKNISDVNAFFHTLYSNSKLEGYSESKGFFNDFAEAVEYSKDLICHGVLENTLTDRTYVRSRGSGILFSPKGVAHEISARIIYEGKEAINYNSLELHPSQKKERTTDFMRYLASICTLPEEYGLEYGRITNLPFFEFYFIGEPTGLFNKDCVLYPINQLLNMPKMPLRIAGNPEGLEKFTMTVVGMLDGFYVK